MAVKHHSKSYRLNMDKSKRLSICYAVPGHNLLTEAGPTRNVLYVAEALSKWADVTVAFRKIIQPVKGCPYKCVELDPSSNIPENLVDDGAIGGTGLMDFRRYLKELQHFVLETASQFDVVLEKSWILSGYLISAYQKQGVPGVLAENIVRMWNEPTRNLYTLTRYLRYRFTQMMIGQYMKRIDAIIAETDELKKAIVNRWNVSADKISVVGLGVDSQLFKHMGQPMARRELGIDTEATVMLYVGRMDDCHDLTPIIKSMCQKPTPSLELHLVGNGALLDNYKEMASQGSAKIYFHGYLPHKTIPIYIAAADVCLAPYNLYFFPEKEVSYTILKVHEYLSCGRPVISVPSTRLFKLIQPDVTGFLIDNEVGAWQDFLDNFPSRERLQAMAQKAMAQYSHHAWDKTAADYLRICQNLVGSTSNLVCNLVAKSNV